MLLSRRIFLAGGGLGAGFLCIIFWITYFHVIFLLSNRYTFFPVIYGTATGKVWDPWGTKYLETTSYDTVFLKIQKKMTARVMRKTENLCEAENLEGLMIQYDKKRSKCIKKCIGAGNFLKENSKKNMIRNQYPTHSIRSLLFRV